ncbi:MULTISPECIES: DUF6148 family protein [Caloramator]|uniref:Uncharacterized protein n=1 Tax=Caloramator australicus RC3 TaxID=857293 RepID=I7LFZ8_9CLOT|nr:MULTISPECIES: DUF6148 family protein [Caloramator]MDO6355291.1 DUF6148 family protein [Caloramator sp. CAR-1]CCJ32880.1 hypothetical protein CAAU_0796 [Caloramator australicus RC3]
MQNERLQKLKERLNMYYEAETAVLSGQEYSMGPYTLKRADLGQIRKAINELEKTIAEIESGGKRKTFRIIPRDL